MRELRRNPSVRNLRLIVALITVTAGVSTAIHAGALPSHRDVARYAEQQLIANYAETGPGAAMIVARHDEVMFRGARGLGDVESATPLSPQSVFKIGSITKQFAAAGLLMLVEAGKVSLDDPLSKFVPGFPKGDAINVREILNHTCGVKNYTEKPEPDVVPIQR